jgi:hypothetical protein
LNKQELKGRKRKWGKVKQGEGREESDIDGGQKIGVGTKREGKDVAVEIGRHMAQARW